MRASVQYQGQLVSANIPAVLSMQGLESRLGNAGGGFTVYGMSDIVKEVALADPSHHTKEINQVIFQGLGKVRDKAISGINDVIPYRQYPNDHEKRDYHKHGVLRGKQYGSLAGDVKRAVSSDASGGSVSIYSKSGTENRWCVLQWLNAGTLQRTSGGRTRIQKDGSTKFTSNGGAQQNRGSITAKNFFLPAAQAGIANAEAFILAETIKILTP